MGAEPPEFLFIFQAVETTLYMGYWFVEECAAGAEKREEGSRVMWCWVLGVGCWMLRFIQRAKRGVGRAWVVRLGHLVQADFRMVKSRVRTQVSGWRLEVFPFIAAPGLVLFLSLQQ